MMSPAPVLRTGADSKLRSCRAAQNMGLWARETLDRTRAGRWATKRSAQEAWVRCWSR